MTNSRVTPADHLCPLNRKRRSREREQAALILQFFPQWLVDNESVRKVSWLGTAASQTLVLLIAARWIERNLHSAQLIHHGIKPGLHLLLNLGKFGIKQNLSTQPQKCAIYV